eukprot:TRINITY_DN740_c0_g1_i1.p1 TRINITY_DN740_c0_g1~~TRINITY_DN740_c0_g1_i1.p1  ORF type:complete len:503 (+),score=66.74 TRINITY_DN740_c0_g1_i1:332-1840(+)
MMSFGTDGAGVSTQSSVDPEAERTSKRFCVAPPPLSPIMPQLTPLDKLTGNHYFVILRQLEGKIRSMRTLIMQRNTLLVEQQCLQLREELMSLDSELVTLKSNTFLGAIDFDNLLSLEDALHSTLMCQQNLYELDLQQLRSNDPCNTEVPLQLSIVAQGNAGPVFKEKPIGPFTLKIMTGATVTQVRCDPVQPEIVETSQRIKRNNSEFENQRTLFKENGMVTFSDLKFSSGTFPNLIRLKFRTTVNVTIGQNKFTKTIESPHTRPFISMTNTGSQWKDAAGTWMKEDCFGDSYEVTLPWFWNYFQKHFLAATKQDPQSVKRCLYLRDLSFMLQAKFGQGLEKQTINQKEFQQLWDWVGPSIKKIRYQKHMLWMFEQGFLACFVTRQEATDQLAQEPVGAFIIRFSERLDGEFVVSYNHTSGVRHYLVQPDDISDKKRTLVDFLGQNKMFTYILQLGIHPTGLSWQQYDKDKILDKHYKRPSSKQSKTTPISTNPYDMQLPV